MTAKSSIQNVSERMIKSCEYCISTVVFLLMPVVYVTTSIVCCVPIGCYYCCSFINEYDKDRKNDENAVEIAEVKSSEPSFTDNTIYGPSDHIAIQMTENPLRDVLRV